MKKVLALLLSVVMLLSFAACEEKSDKKSRTKTKYSSIEETEAIIESQPPLETLPLETEPPLLRMPDVLGLPLSDAMALLDDFTVINQQVYNEKPVGIVVSQSIAGGTFIQPNTTITVEVSMGPQDPVSKFPYIENVNWKDQPIYSGPSYDYDYVGIVEVAGAYTIVDECYDEEGNLWGKLKSGAGWINLTEVRIGSWEQELMTAKYVSNDEYGDYFFQGSDSEYAVRISFEAQRDVFYSLHEMDPITGLEGTELSYGVLYAGDVLVAQLEFPGDLSAYIMIVSDDFNTVSYYVGESGRNGSLVFSPCDL